MHHRAQWIGEIQLDGCDFFRPGCEIESIEEYHVEGFDPSREKGREGSG